LKIFGKQVDRTNAIIAVTVWLLTLIVYLKTMAASVSFWDCGEFIAVSSTLAIPHPPGMPLYVLVGRVFSLLPFFSDMAARVNFLSAFPSTFTALFCYLVGVRLLRPITGRDRFGRFLTFGGAATGALMLSFGLTQWTNSIEAEVYGLSTAMLTATVWLTMLFLEHRGTPLADRLMLLIVFISTLGIGVHMATFLVLPVAAIAFILKKDTPREKWFLVGGFVALELILIILISSRPGELPFYLPVLIVTVIFGLAAFSFENIHRRWLHMGAGLVVSLLPGILWLVGRVGGGEPGPPSSAVLAIGALALVTTAGYAVYTLFQYSRLRNRSESDRIELLYPSVMVITAALLAAITALQVTGVTPFLVISALLAVGVLWILRAHVRWMELIALAAIMLIIIGLKEFVIGLGAALVVIAALAFLTKNDRWKIAVAMILVTALGYSVHAFLPLRSAQDPYINQNHPSKSMRQTIAYIERKQYGSESMIERMFTRRGEWENQFGMHRRMGFLHFFHQQFGMTRVQAIIPFLFGLLGVWEIARRRPRYGLLLAMLLLITSVGLILYMNFADGTRQLPNGRDYLEVRDRDYFFTQFFVLFGLTIGLGVAALVQTARELTASFSKIGRTVLLTLLSVFLLLPAAPLAVNHYECNRSRNHYAFDYAWSLLQSADKNAVLFTNGDNDTFPLWCLQEAFGIRKDVRIINLSLANATWYIKQMRDYMGLEIGWTDDQVDSLRHGRMRDGTVVRIANQVIDALVYYNPTTPMNWCFTVGAGWRRLGGRSIDNQLVSNGLAWRFNPAGRSTVVDVEEAYDFFTRPDGFRLRGMTDPDIYRNETTLRVVGNLVNPLAMLADTLMRGGDYERAQRIAMLAVRSIPHRAEGAISLAQIYSEQGRIDELRRMADTLPPATQMHVQVSIARALRTNGSFGESKRILDSLLAEHPSFEPAFEEKLKLHVQERSFRELHEFARRWVEDNPNHERGRELLRQLNEQILSAGGSAQPSEGGEGER
jgi:hypothetical protein